MVTKKDFELAVKVLAPQLPSIGTERDEIIRLFCQVFSAMNPRFNEKTFRAALDKEVKSNGPLPGLKPGHW
jgi:hypothetical protein